MGSLETHMASLWPHFGLTAMIPAASAPKRSEARPGNLISVLAWEVCGLTWHLPGLFWEFLALIWSLPSSLGGHLASLWAHMKSHCSHLGVLWAHLGSLRPHFRLRATTPAVCAQTRVGVWKLSGLTWEASWLTFASEPRSPQPAHKKK